MTITLTTVPDAFVAWVPVLPQPGPYVVPLTNFVRTGARPKIKPSATVDTTVPPVTNASGAPRALKMTSSTTSKSKTYAVVYPTAASVPLVVKGPQRIATAMKMDPHPSRNLSSSTHVDRHQNCSSTHAASWKVESWLNTKTDRHRRHDGFPRPDPDLPYRPHRHSTRSRPF